jgi:hypothetical protein
MLHRRRRNRLQGCRGLQRLRGLLLLLPLLLHLNCRVLSAFPSLFFCKKVELNPNQLN